MKLVVLLLFSQIAYSGYVILFLLLNLGKTILIMARIIHLVSIILYSVYVTEQVYFLEKDFIDKINEKATTWKVINKTCLFS